jgi:hypothetical protein
MEKYKETKRKWCVGKKICKGCFAVVQNDNNLRHIKSKKHLKLTKEFTEKHTPMELRVLRQNQRKLYNI